MAKKTIDTGLNHKERDLSVALGFTIEEIHRVLQRVIDQSTNTVSEAIIDVVNINREEVLGVKASDMIDGPTEFERKVAICAFELGKQTTLQKVGEGMPGMSSPLGGHPMMDMLSQMLGARSMDAGAGPGMHRSGGMSITPEKLIELAKILPDAIPDEILEQAKMQVKLNKGNNEEDNNSSEK